MPLERFMPFIGQSENVFLFYSKRAILPSRRLSSFNRDRLNALINDDPYQSTPGISQYHGL